MRTEIKLEGFEELEARLTDPTLIVAPLREDVFEPATSIGVKTAVEGVDGGTGIAVRSIQKEIEPMQARVYTAMPTVRAISIEKGRPVGVPVEQLLPQIINWKNAVGHPDSAIAIARGIKQRGVKGRFFMEGAKNAVVEALPRLLSNMAKAIEGRLSR